MSTEEKFKAIQEEVDDGVEPDQWDESVIDYIVGMMIANTEFYLGIHYRTHEYSDVKIITEEGKLAVIKYFVDED